MYCIICGIARKPHWDDSGMCPLHSSMYKGIQTTCHYELCRSCGSQVVVSSRVDHCKHCGEYLWVGTCASEGCKNIVDDFGETCGECACARAEMMEGK